MPVRRVYLAFTNALKVRGFTLDSNVAVSSDKNVMVEFAGEIWVLKVAGKFVMEHPMVAGSMADLERALKTYDVSLISSSPKKTIVQKGKTRIDVRKANRAAGLGRTTEHRNLDKYKNGKSEISPSIKMMFLSSLQDIGFSIKDSEIEMDNFAIRFPDSESVWKMFHHDRVVGEGVCSVQSIDIIKNIISSIVE